MISRRDYFSFNQALLDLYASGLDLETYSQRSFRFLDRLVSMELIVHGMRDLESVNANTIFFHLDRPLPGLEQALTPFGLMAPKYPWFCVRPSTHQGKPHYRSDFYSDRQYRSLDIHSEVFRRWGHENFMSMCIHAERNRVVFFGSSRAKGDFSPEERTLLQMAQPHLANARRLAVSLSAAKPWPLSPGLFLENGFTPRESEVLYWLGEGKSNVEIATILRLGLPTVKGHLTSILNKTGTDNRLAAFLHAVERTRKFREAEDSIWREGPLLFKAPLEQPPTKVG